MAKIRVKVIGKGIPEDPFRVDLPTYIMIPGSEKYADREKTQLQSVEIQVPDDEIDSQGKISSAKIRAKYKGQPKWDKPDVAQDIEES